MLDDVKSKIVAMIKTYLGELNQTWGNTQIVAINEFTNDGLIVRRSKLESCILDITGVLDVENLTINGSDKNLQLNVNELTVLGELTYD